MDEVLERGRRHVARLGGAPHGDRHEPEHGPHDSGGHCDPEHRRVQIRRQLLKEIEDAARERSGDGQDHERRRDPCGLGHPALEPRAHRRDERRGRAPGGIPQPRGEHGEDESRSAHHHECPPPPVADRKHAAQPDPDDAAERHAHGVDADGEGPPPAAIEVRDQRLRRRPVSRFSHPHERAHHEQLPEAPDHRAERGADAPQPDAERDHGPPRLEVAQHAERQRGERQDDHVRRAEPAQPLIGEGELALDRLEQREDDVPVSVVEEIDQREQTEGVRRIGAPADLARRDGGSRRSVRQSPPPPASRGPPSPRGTPRSAAASSRPGVGTGASAAAVCGGRGRTP